MIAAAILIAILVITLGIKIFSSSSETQKLSIDFGKTISQKTEDAHGIVVDEFSNPQKVSELKEGDLVVYTDSRGNQLDCYVLYNNSEYGVQIISSKVVEQYVVSGLPSTT